MPIRHTAPHPLAGKTVTITVDGNRHEYTVEDWADRIFGDSWMDIDGNAACIQYALRAGLSGLPKDDEVMYGKVARLGHLVHVDEIAGVDS